jgi:hypothetical protein
MPSSRSGLVLLVVTTALIASARLTSRAQDRGVGTAPTQTAPSKPRIAQPARVEGPTVSVQDAMLRPFVMPFGEPTSLEEVCRHLRQSLGEPVVLDLAALGRHKVTPLDKVQLDLKGVRLKTGLKLMLDQVGLTYRVVPEDNLLIVTDAEGSEDRLDRVFDELEAVHRDLHTLQDALDEVRATLGIGEGDPTMRQPTIIEELPTRPEEKPEEPPAITPGRARPGV